MRVVKYETSFQKDWDDFVKISKNGTFLFERNFMDYHGDRFFDCSLIIYEKNKIIALLPANQVGDEVYSHLGLSYGGFVVASEMRSVLMLAVFESVIDFFKANDINQFYYKCIPYIYHKQPAEEDLYALFRNRAVLYRRDISTVIDNVSEIKFSNNTKRNIKKALKMNIVVSESDRFEDFHKVLSKVLERHHAKPVHSVDEIILLNKFFPKNIKLYAAFENDDLIAGTIIFDTGRVIHTQYLASSDRGREIGALDLIVSNLIETVYKNRDYFSFGPSTEEQGWVLNEGLIRQKEGFGGRSIVHDFYKLTIA